MQGWNCECCEVSVAGEWVTWLKGSFLPAAVTFAVIPALVYLCFPPEIRKTPEAPHMARLKLKELGPMRAGEIITMTTLLLAVALWVSASPFAQIFSLCLAHPHSNFLEEAGSRLLTPTKFRTAVERAGNVRSANSIEGPRCAIITDHHCQAYCHTCSY